MSVAEIEAAEIALEAPTGGLWADACSADPNSPANVMPATSRRIRRQGG